MSESNAAATNPARWPKLLLLLSLAVNVIVIGLFAGYMMKPERSGRGPDNQIKWIIKLVPEARRDFTKEHFSEIRDEVRSAYMQRSDHLSAIVTAIRVEPFDREGLEAALQARRDGSKLRQKMVQSHMVTLLEAFTPAERIEFADNLDGFLARLKERSVR